MLYVFASLLVIWIVAVQSGCMTMRTADREWPQKLQERGQRLQPAFADVPAPDGRKVHAVCIDASDSLPVIMMVHGSPGSADAFMDYLADTVLSSKAKLIAVDRPGFGYTSGFGRPDASVFSQASDVKAVLDQLAPGRKAVLVGHSLGCPVITAVAMLYPEKVAGLVLLGASIDPDLEPKYWWQGMVNCPPVCFLIPRSLWTSNAEIIPLPGELERMKPLWKNITCPVTMVHAHDDSLVDFGNVAYAQKMLVNTAAFRTLIYDKGDHFIIWSQHAAVRQVILDLLPGGGAAQ